MTSINYIDNNWLVVPSRNIVTKDPHIEIERTPGFFTLPCMCRSCSNERVAKLLSSGCEEVAEDEVVEEYQTVKVVSTQTWSTKKQKKNSPRNYIDRIKKSLRDEDGIDELVYLFRISKNR